MIHDWKALGIGIIAMFSFQGFARTPAIEIEVRIRDPIQFYFWKLPKAQAQAAAKVTKISVYTKKNPGQALDNDEIVWEIETSLWKAAVSNCVYGVLPKGFAQKIPAKGRPPRLEPGRTYYVSCDGEGVGVTLIHPGHEDEGPRE